jgi:predicted alpha/beta hydrolase family esterase
MTYLMKKLYLVHGWGGSDSDLGWWGWVKKKQRKSYKVISFDMPNADEPKIEEWVGYLEEEGKRN